MIDRRNFLKIAAVAGGTAALNPIRSLGSRYQNSSGFFGVHQFIENHPEAVFIMQTNIDVKTNSEAKKKAGLDFGRSVIIPKENQDGGVPLNCIIPIKPNLTCRFSWHKQYTVEGTMGIVTDANFVEGVIESMKELGLSGNQFYIREVSCPHDFKASGYIDMAERTGTDIRDLSAKVGEISENDLQWVNVPEGVWFRKIPYLWPINAPNTWFLNIAKFKAHGMGLTLCCKNQQGTVAHNYHSFCGTPSAQPDHVNPERWAVIKDNYDRHVADGIPRWDRPGADTWNSGIGMEKWATRTLDNLSVSPAELYVIEGIYGRDGDFVEGPGPEGLATDYMSNVIIFSKNQLNVDIIGHWLGGHEPGNFGLFHIAIERDMNNYLNPLSIPVYEWKNGEATLKPLSNFERTPLKTYYLQRDYNGQEEPYWHMVDEPFDYSTVKVDEPAGTEKPGSFHLHQNLPNPFNPYTSIEFSIPKSDYSRLEIYNSYGQLVDVLWDGYCKKGSYMAVWNTNNHSSGVYFYRFRFGSFSETKKMTLLK